MEGRTDLVTNDTFNWLDETGIHHENVYRHTEITSNLGDDTEILESTVDRGECRGVRGVSLLEFLHKRVKCVKHAEILRILPIVERHNDISRPMGNYTGFGEGGIPLSGIDVFFDNNEVVSTYDVHDVVLDDNLESVVCEPSWSVVIGVIGSCQIRVCDIGLVEMWCVS